MDDWALVLPFDGSSDQSVLMPVNVDQVLEPERRHAGILFFDPNVTCGQVMAPWVFVRLIGITHQRRFIRCAGEGHANRITNERQAGCGAVDRFGVVRKQAAQRHGDVLLRDGQFEPKGAEGRGLNAATREGGQRRKAWVTPALIPSALDVLSHR